MTSTEYKFQQKNLGIHSRNTGLYFQGKEIKIQRRNGRPPRRITNPETGWWSMEKKIEACTLYAALGDINNVSQMTGVPVATIRSWKTENWWIEASSQITGETDDTLVAKFAAIANEALDQLIDRLQVGNQVYNPKTGETKNLKLNAKDLLSIATMLTDKRQLLQGKPTSRIEKSSPDDRLKKLAAEFEKFSKAKQINQGEENGTSEEREQGWQLPREGQEEVDGTDSGDNRGILELHSLEEV